ncbi:MAG: MurNAc alpha-1-phosphate uridylyltransferase [Candidatus Azotimanducaceae bacterium]|jgi:MurNAc alpha-1-phosphate uridylyltransferase
MKAMILAAGRGERMLPLTRDLPKPLLPIGKTTLIQRHLCRLAESGVESVVINLHFLGEKIQQLLGSEQFGLQIEYSLEAELLETAGGIYAALPMLGEAPFLVVNADIFTDFDFNSLVALDQIKSPHLVMVPNPEQHPDGDYGLDSRGRLTSSGPTYTYSGIGVYPSRFFDSMSHGKLMLRPLFDAGIEAGQLTGEIFQGDWTDVGTPERYDLLKARFR